MAFRMAPAFGLFAAMTLAVAACVPAPQNNTTAKAVSRPAAPAAVRGDDAMPRSQLVQIQAYLQALGYLRGRPDGVVGSRTRVAITKYQRTSGLTPDGYATLALLRRLR